jgi:hypothetical protein
MLAIHIEDDLELELNQLVRKEHTPPEQLVKDLIASYMEKQKEPELLADLMQELPELSTFKGEPVNITTMR